MSEYTNKDCLLNDQNSYCKTLGLHSCTDCTIGKQDAEFQHKAIDDVETVRALLPNGSMDALTNAKECQLCAGEHKNSPICFAVTDMGNVEPKTTKRNLLGIKTKASIGSMVAAQIPCCAECRKNHRIRSMITFGSVIAALVICLIVLMIPAANRALIAINQMLPLFLFIGVLFIGLLIGMIVKTSFTRSKSSRTLFDVMQVPFIREMVDRGWFSIYGEGKEARLIFSKERLKRGWFI